MEQLLIKKHYKAKYGEGWGWKMSSDWHSSKDSLKYKLNNKTQIKKIKNRKRSKRKDKYKVIVNHLLNVLGPDRRKEHSENFLSK